MQSNSINRVAVVTGAGSGIGKAAAERLLGSGHSVVGVDLDASSLAWMDGQSDAAVVAGDVGTEDTNRAMVDTALDRFGSLDTVVLNAAMAHVSPLGDVAPETIDRVLRVNLRGVVLGLQASIPALERGRDPSLVTVASISGMGGEPFMSLYSATKGGVISLTRSAAVEFGSRGIRINCVCPGPTRTGMTRPTLEADPRVEARLSRPVPLKRLGEPEEIAEVIAFLATPAASFVHGAIVPVDGGITANAGQQLPPEYEASQEVAA
jgi:meso-butanediol dehydrogenase / (S,S)-butanediol dehydrogenase / diacetyl reductase